MHRHSLAPLGWIALLSFAVLAGCETGMQPKLPAAGATATPEKSRENATPPVPVPVRLTFEELDAQIKLYVKLGRYQEAAKSFLDNKAVFATHAAEQKVLQKRIVDGVNALYDKPLLDALASIKAFEKGPLSSASIPTASEALAQAKEVLREYESAMSVGEPQNYSRNAKQLRLGVAAVAKQIDVAQALLNAPENKLAALAKANKVEDASTLYREQKAYFDEHAKRSSAALAEFARVSSKQLEPLLLRAEKALTLHMQPAIDPATWSASLTAVRAAQNTLDEALVAPPFDIPGLRTPPMRKLEQALARIQTAWANRAPDAFFKYDHVAGPSFFDVYPVTVNPASIALSVNTTRLAGKSSAELSAISVSLGKHNTAASRELFASAIARAEKGAQPKAESPENRLLALLKENNLGEATKLYKENQAYFTANAKQQSRALGEFARMSGHIVEPTLATADKSLRPFLLASADTTSWRAAAAAFDAAGSVMDSTRNTPPLEIPTLRSPAYRSLELLVEKTRAAWVAKAPEAFVKYDHASSPNFFSAYPVKLEKAQVTAQITSQRLSNKTSSEINALGQAIGDAIPKATRDVIAKALVVAEAAEKRVSGKAAAMADVAAKAKTGGSLGPNIVIATVPPPPKEPPASFVDSDL